MTTTSTAASASIVTAALTLVVLALLHVLSPEFAPSWRMVSEYANGQYGWVLALMFGFWGISTWMLAAALRSQLQTFAGNMGLWFLVAAGAGEILAALFDINQPLHAVAGLLGMAGLPAAAMLISFELRDKQQWSRMNTPLVWTAQATWISVLALVASLFILFITFTHSGGHVPADGKSLPLGTVLPAGSIAIAGYVNRLIIVVFCAWAILAAWPLRQRTARPANAY